MSSTTAPAARSCAAVPSMPATTSCVVACAVEQSAHVPNFRLAARNESLAAETGVDRHDEHIVDVGGDLEDRADRRRGIQHDSRLGAQRLDGVHRAVQMRQHFHVDRDHRGAGVGERLDVAVRLLNHQVHIERDGGDAPKRFHDRRTHRDVRDEVAVHHVDVYEIGAAALGRGDRVAQGREIGRQNRGGDEHAHRLTSMEIGSPGPIWKPACGLCRMTMPAATPGYGFDPTTATRKPRVRRISAARSPLTPMRSGIT